MCFLVISLCSRDLSVTSLNITYCLLCGRGQRKTVLYFLYYSKCAVWKIQYGGWQIQHGGQSRGVKNLIKEGITIDCISSNVVLNVSRYFSSLLAALFYSMHLLQP